MPTEIFDTEANRVFSDTGLLGRGGACRGIERYFAQRTATSSLVRRSSRALVRIVTPVAERTLDDGELVRAFMNGEDWAAQAIWTRHAPMVFGLLERALGPSGEADDLTQDVFLRTFTRLPTLRDSKALRSFIYSVALRLLKWELRRRRVRRILRLPPTGRLPEVPVRPADSEARQILTRFYAVLEELGANERTAFVLRHMEGLKLEEVSEHMDLSLATVKRLLRRAAERVSALVERDHELSSYARERGALPGGFGARG